MDVAYQALLLSTTLVVTYAVFKERISPTVARLILLTTGALTTPFLSMGPFHLMRLASWLLFVHFPLCLVLIAGVTRKRTPRQAALGLIAALLLWGVAIDAFFIEPHALEINEHRLISDKLDAELTVLILADFQTDRIGDYEREVIRRAVELRPDLVLMPGDYLQIYRNERADQARRFRELIGQLAPPLGVWAVGGNVDPDGWQELFEGTGVQAFPNGGSRIVGDRLRLTGLTLDRSFDSRISLRGPSEPFHIVFGHAPDFALGDVAADLLVAGHTHGGQVRLPLIGPLLTLSAVPRAWAAGVTRLDAGRTLVVSRGIGMERGRAPRLRFLCRPEIVLLRISPERLAG